MPYAVLSCAVMMCWAIALRSYFFTVMPSIANDLGLSTGLAGTLIGSQSIGYGLANWSVGFVPGRRKLRVLAGAALSILGMLAIANAPTVPILFAAAIAAGVGVGFYLPLGLSIIADASRPDRRSRNMGAHELFSTLGHFGGPAFVAVALPVLAWREATVAFTVVGVVACLAFAFLRDEAGVDRPPAGSAPLRLDATLIACVATFAACLILLVGMVSVMPLIMVNSWGIDLSEAASVVSAGRLAGLIGVLIAGLLGDRLGPGRIVRVAYLAAAACTATMALVPYGPLFIAATLGANVAGSAGIVVVTVIVAQVYAGNAKERALSVTIGTAGLIGLAGAPTAFGYVVERGAATAPFAVAALASLLVLLLVGLLERAGRWHSPLRDPSEAEGKAA